MVEQASFIVATRHANTNKGAGQPLYIAATARFENMDFLQPVFVGDVLHVHAKLAYCSPRSMMVHVVVQAENIGKGTIRTTNTAKLWYVALEARSVKDTHPNRDFEKGAQPVPAFTFVFNQCPEDLMIYFFLFRRELTSPEEQQIYKEAEYLYKQRKAKEEDDTEIPIP